MPLKNNDSLNIIEIFASVQGETSFVGFPTCFIRLAACNLRCTWCDTTYSFGRGTPWSLADILEKTRTFGCQHVCVTGGEPLLQPNVHPLMHSLCNEGYTISLETSGSLSIKPVDPRVHIMLDVKCPGSGMESKNHWENIPLLRSHDEVKMVIKDRVDYDYAVNICHKFSLFEKKTRILFSPVFDEMDSKELVEWILEDRLPVRLNLQVHKYIWAPNMQGV